MRLRNRVEGRVAELGVEIAKPLFMQQAIDLLATMAAKEMRCAANVGRKQRVLAKIELTMFAAHARQTGSRLQRLALQSVHNS